MRYRPLVMQPLSRGHEQPPEQLNLHTTTGVHPAYRVENISAKQLRRPLSVLAHRSPPPHREEHGARSLPSHDRLSRATTAAAFASPCLQAGAQRQSGTGRQRTVGAYEGTGWRRQGCLAAVCCKRWRSVMRARVSRRNFPITYLAVSTGFPCRRAAATPASPAAPAAA